MPPETALPKPSPRRGLMPLSARLRGAREGPLAKRCEGEVGVGKRSEIPRLTPPSPPPGAER
jgi:hypothetical protein